MNEFSILLEFEDHGVWATVTILPGGGLQVDISEDTTYELIAKVSEYFGTRDINIHSEVRDSGGCDSCNFQYGATVLFVQNATKGLPNDL